MFTNDHDADTWSEIERERLLRLWPEVDVYGRLNRLIAAERERARRDHPSAAREPAA